MRLGLWSALYHFTPKFDEKIYYIKEAVTFKETHVEKSIIINVSQSFKISLMKTPTQIFKWP